MKRLYLVRHAKSSWDGDAVSDFDRPLNARGKRDAPHMGEHLRQVRKVAPDVMMSSPARRARSTARRLAKALGYAEDRIVWHEDIYEGGMDAILALIHQAEADRELMVVGHNPDLTYLARAFSGEPVDHVPTCGVFCVDFEVGAWADVAEGKGKKAFFDVPKEI